MMTGDILKPTVLVIPTARTRDGRVSGAYVLTAAVTGAVVMSGADICVYDGSGWRQFSGAQL